MLLSNFQCSLAAFLPDFFFSATLGCEVTSAGPGCSFKDRSFFTKTCDIRLLPTSAANTVVQRKESSFIFSPVHRPWHAITLPQLHTTQPVHVCLTSAHPESPCLETLSSKKHGGLSSGRGKENEKKTPEQIRNFSTIRNRASWIFPFSQLVSDRR